MAPTLASTTSRHAHLSPALLWSLVAIILVNALLLIIWLVHCRRTAARARKIISVDLPETKTTTSASDPRSNWSWIRNPRLWKNHRGGDNQGLTGDKAGTNVSSDTTASTEDLEAGMRVIVIQVRPYGTLNDHYVVRCMPFSRSPSLFGKKTANSDLFLPGNALCWRPPSRCLVPPPSPSAQAAGAHRSPSISRTPSLPVPSTPRPPGLATSRHFCGSTLPSTEPISPRS
ncbi:uncharacterized protein C8Q71DRAFT_780707 [Rhodofomes roseus]|uniref:Uncharacterized protein n=1 Tax=Rhodofomes roseus TaxID=34475 RepID=A0ABQ8K5B7_9APHY|nr:uncharacterized protein C8Q71DRAFT_780707 [Rhodofomes roseus]KAH9831838.1 hypothetical protein C8Q71DRAFT_780707 [Rhodofomes roseus]